MNNLDDLWQAVTNPTDSKVTHLDRRQRLQAFERWSQQTFPQVLQRIVIEHLARRRKLLKQLRESGVSISDADEQEVIRLAHQLIKEMTANEEEPNRRSTRR